MTIKTFLIAVALIGGFFAFLSVTWDVSAWLLKDPETIADKEPSSADKEPSKVQPAKSVEGNAAAPDQKTEPEQVEAKQSQDVQTEESGSYDDSWSGEAPVRTENDLTEKPDVKATTSRKSDSEDALVVPFASDDRENVEPETDAGASKYLPQNGDPYQPDERETN